MAEPAREEGAEHGKADFSTYGIGYALAMALSAVSFCCVMLGVVPHADVVPAVVAAAVAQVVVHLLFFLHMTNRSTPRWNIIVFCFAIIVIAILIGGSVWIMASANGQMMPPNDMMMP
jgi:cytochrome o ubiquinol oxidase operon protein cyoD